MGYKRVPVKRRGFVTVLCVLVLALLSLLMLWESAEWSSSRRYEGESALRSVLENEMQSALERTTAYLKRVKISGPWGDGVIVEQGNGLTPDDLEVALPPEYAGYKTERCSISVRLHWCLFTPPASFPPNGAQFPPSLSGVLRQEEQIFYKTSYESSSATAAVSAVAEKDAWRILVRAEPFDTNLPFLEIERVVLLDR